MTEYLLDTNHASRLMSEDPALIDHIGSLQSRENRLAISVTVLAELYFAVYASRRQTDNLRRLQALSNSLLLWPFDSQAAQEFGKIQAEQKQRGRPIPLPAQKRGTQKINASLFYILNILTVTRPA